MSMRVSARRIMGVGRRQIYLLAKLLEASIGHRSQQLNAATAGGETGTMDSHTCAGKTLITRKVPAPCV